MSGEGLPRYDAPVFPGTAAPGVRSREERIRSFASLGYVPGEIDRLSDELLDRSFPTGCPIAYVRLRSGDTLVDLGAGQGLDCTLLARGERAKPRLIALDVSPMALRSARDRSFLHGNGGPVAHFAAGDGERLPIADEAADWAIANGLFCLVSNPERVLSEMFRILRPGGRVAIGFWIVELPRPLDWVARWMSGIRAGRTEADYKRMLRSAGFRRLRVETRHRYTVDQAGDLWGASAGTRRLLRWARLPLGRAPAELVLRGFTGVDVTAVKPRRAVMRRGRGRQGGTSFASVVTESSSSARSVSRMRTRRLSGASIPGSRSRRLR